MKHKILMTLALLITAVTGTWAQEVEQSESFTTNTSASVYTGEHFNITPGSPGDGDGFVLSQATTSYATIEALNGEIITKVEFTKGYYDITKFSCEVGTTTFSGNVATVSGVNQTSLSVTATNPLQIKAVKVYFTIAPAGPEVTWNATTKTATFEMPDYDVEIAPIYAPTAKWAKDKEVDQLPTAIEGIIAGTEDAIVKAGTVVEGQGTVMYFATTDAEMTAEKAAAADGWLSTLPTAAGYDDAQTVYVWYYIKGADTPDGQTATAENTFNDSEICTTPIEVTLLSNKFDIAFNAANANTIESGKATVKVGDAAKTLDEEGQLKQVKMGSKVTLTAATGYKFRKVEATKGISTLKSVKIGNYTVYYAEGETWYQAFWRDENNNCGLETSVGRVFTYNDKSLRDSGGDVYADAVIDPSKGYYIAD